MQKKGRIKLTTGSGVSMEKTTKTAKEIYLDLKKNPNRARFGFGNKAVLVNIDPQKAYTATDEFIIGSPLFKKATLHLRNGNTFSIEAKNNSEYNFYIQSASLNNKNYENSFIRCSDIQKGGLLEFNVSNTSNKSWGSKEENLPFSMSRKKK